MTDLRPDETPKEAREPGPQPDPMLKPGRRGSGWIWFIVVVAVIVVVGTLYALNPPSRQNTASDAAPPQTTGQSAAPSLPNASGRNTSSAPPEQTPPSQSNPSR
jgi:hypothetical protein